MESVQLQAKQAARAAIQQRRVPANSRFFIKEYRGDNGEMTYSLWRRLWGNEEELVEVLEESTG